MTKDPQDYQREVRELQSERKRLRRVDGGGEGDRPADPPRRMTLSNVVELLLTRNAPEHSSIDLSRNAKGETQISVTVRTGDVGGIETIEEAEQKVTELFDRLRARYPMASGHVGAVPQEPQS